MSRDLTSLFGGIYRSRRVLVTGCTGFKGSWLCAWLLELGADVHGLADGIPTQPSLFEALELPQRIEYRVVDVRATERVLEAVDQVRPDFVFHLAAQALVIPAYRDPLTTLGTNIMGTAAVLDALRRLARPCRAVMITSDKCYDNVEWNWGYRETDALGGKDPYSASKGAAEFVIKTYYHSYFSGPEAAVRVVSTRAGNVIGGGDWAANRIVPDCIRAWSAGEAVEVRSPQATRPWQHVLEPLSGYLRAGQMLDAQAALSGRSYNFGPRAEQVDAVLGLLQELARNWRFDRDGEHFRIIPNPNFHEAGLLKLNCDRALAELNWTSTLSFAETAELTARWYDRYYHGGEGLYDFTIGQLRRYVEAAAAAGKSWT